MPPTALVVGLNDSACLGGGWHERERDGRCGLPYRATGPSAELRLAPAPGARGLALLVAAPVDLLGAPARGALLIEAGAVPLRAPLELRHDGWVLRRFPLKDPRGVIAIRLEADRAIVPDHALRNGDGRALGWFVSAVWQE
ncbi:MAG: hypothetical protein SF028_10270 [Candidatus Sumerlaeia bacterium]|nr:hypothetical protein [Candidatus Sumerlaeia bacterium]